MCNNFFGYGIVLHIFTFIFPLISREGNVKLNSFQIWLKETKILEGVFGPFLKLVYICYKLRVALKGNIGAK